MIISRSVLLTMRNVSDKNCRENQDTHFVFSDCLPKIVPCVRPWSSYEVLVILVRFQWKLNLLDKVSKNSQTQI